MNARILRLPEVRHITGLSRATIYRRMEAGDFPRAVKLTAYSIGWNSTLIEAWVAARTMGVSEGVPAHGDAA